MRGAGRSVVVATRGAWAGGSLYVATLAVVGVVALMGLGAIVLARGSAGAAGESADARRARALARSGVEYAAAWVRFSGADTGVTSARFAADLGGPVAADFDGREALFELFDDADGDLLDDPRDPVRLRGIGRVGAAEWAEEALAVDDAGRPLSPLRAALHATDGVRVEAGATPVFIGGPLSIDGTLTVIGSVTGDVEAGAIAGTGTITGTAVPGAARRGGVPRATIQMWIEIATELEYQGDLGSSILAPGVNSYDPDSGTNEHGVYLIRTGGADLLMNQSRVYGTLIVDTGGGTFIMEESSLIEPGRIDAPALIVIGNADLALIEDPFTEGIVSLNPPGAPYLGVTDDDLDDEFESGIFGLVHVLGRVNVIGTWTIRGTMIVDGTARIMSGETTFMQDPSLLMLPPLGYGDDAVVGNARLVPGTVRRVVSP